MTSKKKLIWLIGAGAIVIVVGVAVYIRLFRQDGMVFFNWWQGETVIITPSVSPSVAPSTSPAAEEIRILFLGDLMFDRTIRQAAQKNSNNFIFAKITELLMANDLVVANLEGSITDDPSISLGTEPGSSKNYFFTFDPSLANTLFDNNIRLVNLGNNHILNFAQTGLDATKKYLNGAGVSYFGTPGGEGSVVKNIKGVKIAFVNYNQFSGSAAAEQSATLEEIKKVKTQAKALVVYAHWGTEYDSAPNEAVKNLAREFISAGADLVIGSHPHVIQSSEEYQGKKIYYSLGNFVFDQYFSEAVRQGLGVVVKVNSQNKQIDFEEKKLYLQTNGQTVLLEL